MIWLTEPLQYPFMQSALITGLAVSIVCALLSCYLVLKGWSLMGDAISHAVLPGVVLSSLFAIPLFIGAFTSGLACAVLTGYIKEHSRLKEDTVMGIVFSGMFAIGLVMFTHVETDQHLMHILFGNILGIPEDLMWQTLAVCAAVAVTTLLFYKDLLMVCFDKSHARVVGLNIRALHYLLLILIALVTVAAIQVVGVVLVVAMLVGPGVVALMLCRRFEVMMLVATLVSVFSTLAGVVISYHIDGSTSACIVLVQATLFITAFSGKQLSPIKNMAGLKVNVADKA
ncbi:metal ABC transporter permease [Vibrio sp. SCSIO 43137]|uniref:metal ABC transporter permease n=1 Tax=Vibrio sp. SCSIO 43137 TaxID=3021011 RepID=UPI0023079E36|nr:metal ABC transporter permease [Vibrio sp. SCSIO 43137]WCE31954.1 metal ABC transporter permease [Vibrio sp. SCSIO 43137]